MNEKLERDEIEKLKYNDIKKMAKEMNLDTSGSKQDIIDRICNVNQKQNVEEEKQDESDQEQNAEIQEQHTENEEENTKNEEQSPENTEQNVEEEKQDESDQQENQKAERIEIDGVLKVIYNGYVRLRRTAEYDEKNENVIRLEPNGSFFRVVAIVRNENGGSFYELSNGAYIANDKKLVDFKME